MDYDAEVGIIGAGPIGLELAIALKKAQIPHLQFDKGQAGEMIYRYPPGTRFFSSSDRIGIAGIPVQTADQQKCSREAYLTYLRMVIQKYGLSINTYEDVTSVKREREGFFLKTASSRGKHSYHVQFLVLATGGTSHPRLLNVPGEELSHVSVRMEDPHRYFQKEVVIVGGKNSAAESALRCFHAGAKVIVVHRKTFFDRESVKYWLLPELEGRIKRGEVRTFFEHSVRSIQPDRITLYNERSGEEEEIGCDFVVKAIGFEADMGLFRQLDVVLSDDQGAPKFNPDTMETPVKGLYVAGTAIGGTQSRYKVYIENTHHHVEKIVRAIGEKLHIETHPEEHVTKVNFRKLPPEE